MEGLWSAGKPTAKHRLALHGAYRFDVFERCGPDNQSTFVHCRRRGAAETIPLSRKTAVVWAQQDLGRPAEYRFMTISRDLPPRRRRKHSWPVCQQTGKKRLGERKDVKLALEAVRHSRSQADLDDQVSTWTVIRGYRCDHCNGWHLTSKAARKR